MFKDYNGNPIELPEHTHIITDTKRYETTAFVSISNPGFIRKEDVAKIDSLKTQAEFIDSKLQEMVFVKE